MTEFELAVEKLQRDAMESAMAEMTLEARTKRKTAEVLLEKAKIERTIVEETLAECRQDREHRKQNRRPSQERYVEMEFDSERGQWAARHASVVAYGDTPEMACDNFDHLWIFGDNDA